jgi:hypothetical protein
MRSTSKGHQTTNKFSTGSTIIFAAKTDPKKRNIPYPKIIILKPSLNITKD